MRSLHCTLAGLMVAWLPVAAAAQERAGPLAAGPARFTIFVQGIALGSEEVTVTGDASGTVISGSSRIAPPVDVVTRRYEIRYTAEMRPLEVTAEGTVRGQIATLRTTFANGIAHTETFQAGRGASRTDKVVSDPVVLLNQASGSYEALAIRLNGLQAGAEVSVFVAPRGEMRLRIGSVSPERIRVPGALISGLRYQLIVAGPGAEMAFELWTDASGRMIRLTVPAQSFDVVRDDVASVAARREVLPRPGDEQATIPASGFSIAATVSRPASAPSPPPLLPAVVLVSGQGSLDRDETVAGVPVFAQLAGAIADAGFLVIRYDKRGVGQSGGRVESTTIADYAEDVRVIVRYLSKQKDVDRKRIAAVGYSEGGWVALVAASMESRIAALGLVAAPGLTGAELNLEQQRHALDRITAPEAEKQAKIELQKRIQQAAIKGTGWDGVPKEMRRLADTPWFQSYLLFDPARVMKKVRQPILIVHGEIDRQVPPHHANRLEALARERKSPAGSAVEAVKVPAVNHLLVAATTGEVDEYVALKDKTVSPQVVSAITEWLQKALPGSAAPPRR